MTKVYTPTSCILGAFTKRLVFVLLFCAGLSVVVKAQVSVTASAGTPGPTAYLNLKAAFDAINAGTHQGIIDISILSNTTELATAVLNPSSVPSSYTAVNIRPFGGGARSISGNIAGAIIKLNGADNVTINGFTGSGTTRDLTISNSNTSTSGAEIWVGSASSTDGAGNNTIQNCVITGNSSTSTLAGIIQSSGTTMGNLAESPNSNNNYSNNAVSLSQYGIAVVGGNTQDVNNVVANNLVTNLSYRGIFISQQTNVLISKNTITGVISNVGGFTTQSSGIFVGGTISGGVIEKNVISNIRINIFWGCAGILLNSTTTTTNLVVSNNFIYDVAAGGWFDADTIDDQGFGIAVNTGGGYKIWYNSIDMSTNQPNNTTYNAPTSAIWLGDPTQISPAPTNLDIRNNIFSNRQTTGQRFSIYSRSPRTAISIINYNDYYSTNNVGYLGTNRVTLANWQAATLQDASSVTVNPLFTSTVNLHLLGNSPLNGLATPIAGIITDIDGDTRDVSTPDIGADEFTPPNCSGSLGGTAVASVTDLCASGSAVLSSSGYSFGAGITYTWQYSTVSATGPWNSLPGPGVNNPLTAGTGTISTTTYYRLQVTCSFTGTTGYSNVVTIVVNNPALSGTTPGSRCGVGTVVLAAAAPVGSTLSWYAASTGGSPLGTGSPFTTPLITASTNFYVSVSAGGVNASGGKPSTAGADGGYNGTDAGLIFDATTPFKIISVKMYPQASGSIQIQALTSAGVPIATSPVITFAAAAPGGIVVPLNFNIPAGISHRLVLSSNPSNITIWRDFSPLAFPYALGTVGSITNGWLGISTSAYYYFYDWQVTTACESLRTAVLATVNTPPAVTVAPGVSPVICSGSSVTLTASSANGGYVYTWNPGALSGPVQTFTPTATTTYVLTANDGTCRNDINVTITVNQTPTALTVTPTVASGCPNNALTVTTSGALIPNQSIFKEDAETFPLTKFTLSQNGTPPSLVVLNQNTNYFQQGISSIHLTHGNYSDGYLTSINIPLTGFSNPRLTYYQIAGLEANSSFHYDTVEVQYSLNGGTSWTTFPASTYLGAGTLSNAGYVSFDNTSYPEWQAQFTSAASNPGTTPATSLWKLETIDLSTWGVGGAVGGPSGSGSFKIRYHLKTDVSIIYYGFLLDNINIKGTGHAPTTWSPIANLYHDLAHTLPITSGTDTATTVYYYVTANTAAVTYTATASGGGTCTVTGTTILSATSLPPSVTVSANPGSTICSGQSVTFTATPVNGGAGAAYQWKINGANVGASVVGQNTFTVPNALHPAALLNGETVTAAMAIPPSSNPCYSAGGTFPSSNTITMTVNPTPATNIIAGAGTVCNGTLTTLTETPASGTITAWQWYLNGTPISTNPSTFNAVLPGSYTVAIQTSFGCRDTSAPKILTLPTYTITANAGANGTINPNGTVVVNCGSNITFTITPNSGYSIQDVIVDGSSVGAVNTYTFSNVTANGHTINAIFYIVGCSTPANASAGSNGSICANSNYSLTGSITGGATTGSWSTNGTGTFSPNNNYPGATSYIPSAADITAGQVKLSLTSAAPGLPCLPSTDTITVTIKPSPAVAITGIIGLCSVSSTTTLTADTSATGVYISGIQWYKAATPLGTTGTQLINSTGNYSVIVTAVNGCTSSSSVSINVFTAPTITISGTGPICTGASINLNAGATAGSGTVDPNGYKWYLGGVLIPSATTATLSATLPGNYQATTTNSNGCVSALSNNINLAADSGPLSGVYTIGAGPASCTNYISFATALNDLNTRSINGNCQFIVGAGYTETAPAGGLKLGSNIAPNLNAASVNFTITFQKSGSGANPKITAYTNGTGLSNSAQPDGIFALRGINNVTITQIDLTDDLLANTTTATQMEYGYGLFKASAADGAQGNSILNCTITLNKANAAAGTLPMPDGATGILVLNATDIAATTALSTSATSGANSNNKFYSNTITNCHGGIVLSGFATATASIADTRNDVGGTSAATGNFIYNFGNSGDANRATGIRVVEQFDAIVSYNSINNNDGSGSNTTNELRGIRSEGGTGASITITGNTITLTSSTTGSQTTGIENGLGSTPSSNTILISDNIMSISTATAGSANMTGVSNTATAASVYILNNAVQNCSLAGTGIFAGISNTAPILANTNVFISSNSVKNNIKTSTGTMTLVAVGSPTNSTISSNIISGNTVIGGAANVILNCITGATSNYTVSGNTIYNNGISGMSGSAFATVYGYVNIGGPQQETLQDNIIRKLYVTGNSSGLQVIRGLYHNTSSAATHFRIVTRNTIDSLYSSAAMSAAIAGIYSQVGYNVSISKNKITRLFPGQSTTLGSFARAINIQSGTTVKVFNNLIALDLTQTPSNNGLLKDATSFSGIDVPAGTPTVNIYFNTIRLAGAGSGTGFGTSGISFSVGTVDIRNNIVVNLMTPGGGAGVTAALRKIGTPTYATSSNNNNWYTTETATTPLYYTGTPFATLAAFKASVTPRETVSLDNLPVFVNVSQNDLHLDPANNCNLDGAGSPIPTYTDDYDGDTRDALLPDPGMDEFDGAAAGFTWKGLNTDWENPSNWCGGVPTITSNVIIPGGKAFYPIIVTTTPVANNMTINVGGSITLTPLGQLSTKGTWYNDGVITNNGLITLNGTVNQTFPGAGAGTIPAMASLTVNNTGGATINKALTITGTLKPKAGNIAVNALITLHSDASGTARVDTVQGTISYGAAGKFSVERYISSLVKKAWHFLSAPIGGNQTINQAWQEGELPGVYTPTGYGMQIVGPTSAGAGFDMNNTLPSLKVYNSTSNLWTTVAGTTGKIDSVGGYMAFIRGDRGSNLFTSPPSATTLRTAGPIKTGTITVSNPNSNTFISVGNPYPSAVDFASTTRAGLLDLYYLWDPKLGTYGAYQTFAGPGYVPAPGGGSYTTNKAIESGQAFFVKTAAGPAPHSITFTENSKSTSNAQVGKITLNKQLNAKLYLVIGDSLALFDGNRVDFNSGYSNLVDDNDAPKLSNFGENIGILKNGKSLGVERRGEIVATDTIFYQLGQFRQQQYALEFTAENVALPGMTAYLDDIYLNTKTIINLEEVSLIKFTVTADPASQASDRFRLVFKVDRPIVHTVLEAFQKDANIAVNWNVTNEYNISNYIVERSADGLQFNNLTAVPAHGFVSTQKMYTWLDQQPLDGNNFYRVKSVDNAGVFKFTDVVKVQLMTAAAMTVFPNPVKEDRIVKVSFRNQPEGMYTARLVDEKGQFIADKIINHHGMNSVYNFELSKVIAHGSYLLQLFYGAQIKTTVKLLY